MKREVNCRLVLHSLLVALTGSLPTLAVHAADPIAPNAGSLLQQIQPVVPPAPPSGETGLSIEQPASGTLPPGAPFLVNHIEINGNSRIDTSTLHALVADAEGRSLTLPQLGDLAARISGYYHAHGYPLARALIPAQAIQSGVVQIEVIEARYGSINLDNHSRVSDRLLQATLGGLQAGTVVTQSEMDRSLLLLSDIPGVAVNATLKPGAVVGTSDLQVDTSSTPMVSGNVSVDNDGDRYTGRERLGATVNLLDPLHQGDILSVSGLSAGRGMNYGRLSYEALLDGEGTRLGGAWSALDYQLGGPLSSLGGHGSAQVGSLWMKQPLVRSRDLNLYAQIQYDHLQLHDETDTSGIQTNRHLDNVVGSLSGDSRDGLLAGAVNTWSASWTYGHVSFDNAAAQSDDAATADTQGGFSEWNLRASRLQNLGPQDALYLGVTGQWASGNLDPSQKMIAGGPATVRAYDINAISGDAGVLVTAEWRHTFRMPWNGTWQMTGFVDSERVRVNRSAFAAGTNSATLSGAGLGLNWSGADQFSAQAYLATPIGPAPELVGSTASVRLWFQLSKAF